MRSGDTRVITTEGKDTNPVLYNILYIIIYGFMGIFKR